MTYIVDYMTDAYLYEIAEYFTTLDLPYPPLRPVSAPLTLLTGGDAFVRRGNTPRSIPACVQVMQHRK